MERTSRSRIHDLDGMLCVRPAEVMIANLLKCLLPLDHSAIYLKKILGRTRVNQGTQVMMKRPTKKTSKKGAKERNIFPTSIPAKLQAMNIPMPMGGRKIPMPRHAMHNIPKWI